MSMSNELHRFGQWQFAPDFSRARAFLTGVEVTFTRAERAILGTLSQRPGRIVSRDELLDQISGEGSDTGQRSVDFLINRLRRKLGDPARNPNFIATQYGEGYVWIAREPEPAGLRDDAHIVIGPIQGLAPSGEAAERGWMFVRRLAGAISFELKDERNVSIVPTSQEISKFDPSTPRIGIGVRFLSATLQKADLVLSLRRLDTQATIMARRVTIGANDLHLQAERDTIAALSAVLIEEIWTNQSSPARVGSPEEDAPLPVRMHEAEIMLAQAQSGLTEGERRLRAAIDSEPGNFDNLIMLATAIHSNLVIGGFQGIRSPSDFVRATNEIENLVFAAIEHLEGNDILTLAAAKLLWFVDPRWRQLAMDMAEDVFARTTNFITAFSTVGQLRMWDGRGEEALALFDRALEFLPVKTAQVGLYLTVQKAMAHLSMGDLPAASTQIKKVIEHDPRGLPRYSLMFDLGEEFDREGIVKSTCAAMSEADARAFLYYMHYMFARHFVDPHARRNFMQEPASIVRRYFGDAAIPFEAHRDIDDF